MLLNQRLTNEISGLQDELKKYTDRDAIFEKYIHDNSSGTLILKSNENVRVCYKCFQDKGGEPRLTRKNDRTFHCEVCDKYFYLTKKEHYRDFTSTLNEPIY